MQQYPLLQTKLHVPGIRLGLVSCPRQIEWLNEGLVRKLTLISVPTGFGKTTLVSELPKRVRSFLLHTSILERLMWEMVREPGA
jgi:ATP/maltotriose-dependent transcriptional regulator MalT